MMDDTGAKNNSAESEGADLVDPGSDEASAHELTPEEQMARFEDALKDEDWGHQPC